MPTQAEEILEREFLQVRSSILDIAAALDRQDRAGGNVQTDERRKMLEAGIAILASETDDRASKAQLLFSRDYDANWREKYAV